VIIHWSANEVELGININQQNGVVQIFKPYTLNEMLHINSQHSCACPVANGGYGFSSHSYHDAGLISIDWFIMYHC
jgi:hypothetical protein